jgi:hypothetical protein
VALGFLALYQLTFERVWLDRARSLGDSCVAHFRDERTGDFYDTASDAEKLVTRPRDITDNATPAGSSLAAELLLLLAEFTGDAAARTYAGHVVDSAAEPMARYATMFGHLLGAADLAVNGAVAVAIAGDPGAEDHRALAGAVAARYVPALVLAGGRGDSARGLARSHGRTRARRRTRNGLRVPQDARAAFRRRMRRNWAANSPTRRSKIRAALDDVAALFADELALPPRERLGPAVVARLALWRLPSAICRPPSAVSIQNPPPNSTPAPSA